MANSRHLRSGSAAGVFAALACTPLLAQEPVPVEILTRECEGSRGGDEIVVCGRREVRSRYRLPEEPDQGFDPAGDVDSVSRERNRLMEPGASGTGSCSPVGLGGFTGCQSITFRNQIDQYAGRPPSARNGYRRGR